jgi:hypothetical protein
MDVIVDAANVNSGHLVFSGDTSNVSPNAIFDLRPDKMYTVLCAENDVKIDLRICICHPFHPSRSDVKNFTSTFPWVKTPRLQSRNRYAVGCSSAYTVG